MSEEQQDQAEKDPFYVGYFPLPKAYFMPLLLLVILMIGGGVAMGIGLSAQQGDPGDGVWDLSQQVEIKGIVRLKPYPMIHPVAGKSEAIPTDTLLVVSEGKIGSQERLKQMNGKVVTIKGHLLHREGHYMLEIPAVGENLITAHPEENMLIDTGLLAHVLGGKEVEFKGEIIDSKCFLGAMKPGQGKTHKACAILCLKGGIPPAFVVWEQGKVKEMYLIEMVDGMDEEKELYPHVGDQITIKGSAIANGDWPILRIDANSISK